MANEQRIESPYQEWPGYIVVPKELTAAQFAEYWRIRLEQDEKGDKRPDELRSFSSRQHMVLDWKIDGLKTSDVTPDGLNLPSIRIALFVIAATQQLIRDATSLPNLRGPSSDTTNSTA